MKYKKTLIFLLVCVLAIFLALPYIQNYSFKKELKGYYLDKNIVLNDKNIKIKRNSENKNYEVNYSDSSVFYANKGNYPDLITYGLEKYLNEKVLNSKNTEMVFLVYYDKDKKILLTDYPSDKIYFLKEDNKLYYENIEKYLSEKEQNEFYNKLAQKQKEFFKEKVEFENIDFAKYIEALDIYPVFYLDSLKENLSYDKFNIYSNIVEAK